MTELGLCRLVAKGLVKEGQEQGSPVHRGLEGLFLERVCGTITGKSLDWSLEAWGLTISWGMMAAPLICARRTFPFKSQVIH